MRSVPDTVGRKLTNARCLLGNTDWQIEVEQTRPPSAYKEPSGPRRVIQVRHLAQDAVTLIVARQISGACNESE